VLSINAKKNTVVVEHVGIIKRPHASQPFEEHQGRIVEKEAGINVSNVMVVCGSCGKHTRIWPHRAAGRHESTQLPALQPAFGQVKDKVEEGDEEPITGKIPDGDGARAHEALWAGRT